MAATPPIKFTFDTAEFDRVATQLRRRVGAMGLGVELASQVTPELIESVLEKFRSDQGHAKSESDLRWVAEFTPNMERMVTDGLAWLIAAQEYAAAIESAQKTED